VLAVRESRRNGTSYRALAKEFEIPIGTAWNFCNETSGSCQVT
jgi:hypothetical protein